MGKRQRQQNTIIIWMFAAVPFQMNPFDWKRRSIERYFWASTTTHLSASNRRRHWFSTNSSHHILNIGHKNSGIKIGADKWLHGDVHCGNGLRFEQKCKSINSQVNEDNMKHRVGIYKQCNLWVNSSSKYVHQRWERIYCHAKFFISSFQYLNMYIVRANDCGIYCNLLPLIIETSLCVTLIQMHSTPNAIKGRMYYVMNFVDFKIQTENGFFFWRRITRRLSVYSSMSFLPFHVPPPSMLRSELNQNSTHMLHIHGQFHKLSPSMQWPFVAVCSHTVCRYFLIFLSCTSHSKIVPICRGWNENMKHVL